MSDFDYLALDTAGRERRGSVRAASIDDARAVLGARKLYVVRMEATRGSASPSLLSRGALFRKKLSTKQLTLFTRQVATLVQVTPLEEALRLRFDRRLLRLPLFGRLLRDLHAARLARTLSTMVASRLPLLEGLKLTTNTINNRALRAASTDITEAIRTGGSLSVALRRAGVFPPLLVYLAASGEASGKLDIMLERAADYLEREFDGFTATALSLLEPAIIVVMGGIVAMIVLSILLPILQLDTLASGV